RIHTGSSWTFPTAVDRKVLGARQSPVCAGLCSLGIDLRTLCNRASQVCVSLRCDRNLFSFISARDCRLGSGLRLLCVGKCQLSRFTSDQAAFGCLVG